MRRLLLLVVLPMLLNVLPQLQQSSVVEEALTQEEREISGELTLDGSYDAEAALTRLWDRLLAAGKEHLSKELRHVGVLLSAAIFCALGEALCADAGIREFVSLGVCAATAVFFLGGSESLIQTAAESLQRLKDYSAAAMPLLFTAAAASGAVSSSAGRYAAFCLASDVTMQLAGDWIMPLIRAYLALSLSNSLFGSAILESFGKVCRWAAVTLMTVVTTVFCAYIGLTGLVTGSADAIAVKAAKSVISGALPVVGGILADSASAVLSTASLICGSAGAFSMIAIAGICIGPVASLGIKLIAYKGTAAAVESISGGRLSRLIASVGTTAAMLLGLLGSFACILYFSIVTGLRALGVG